MIQHGRDMGTMEFIFAKGGTVADMNYVMFDVQDNSWEPLIKAVAERDNSHPDIIRKQAAQQQIFGMPNEQFRPAVPAAGTAIAPNPRAVKQANRAMRSAQAGQNVRDGSTGLGDLAGAGFYGQAAMQAGKNIMGAGSKAVGATADAMGRAYGGAKEMTGQAGRAAMDAGGRALTAVKDSGMGERMKNFMGAAGRGISDLRHAPAAAKQSYMQGRAGREDNARRSALESGLSRGQRENDTASRRLVPGSANYDTQMDREKAMTSQGLARDYNITPQTNDDGQATQSIEDAMRNEVKEIGDRRAQPQEGFMAGMKRRGDERRGAKGAQQAAYAPSNIAEEEVATGSPEAEAAANADAVPLPDLSDLNIDMSDAIEEAPPQDPQAGPPTPVEPETATATETDARENAFRDMFGRQNDERGTGYAMGGDSGKRQLQRGMDSDIDLSNVDQKLTEEMIQTLGINNRPIGQAIMQRLRALPQYVKEKAIQGDPQAKERVQDEAEKVVQESGDEGELNFDNFDMGSMQLSEDNHAKSWDSVLKGLNVR